MRALIVFALALLSPPLLLTAFEDGPLPGFTGGFGEKTCHECHFDSPANEPGGSIEVTGVPKTFTASHQYSITISVRRPELKRAGFELSSRFSEGAHRGEDAGVLTAPDDRLRIITSIDKKVHYIQHTKASTQPGTPGEVRWSFIWTAPAVTGSPVIFNVAGNAANGDSSPGGDYVYTTEVVSSHPQQPAPRVFLWPFASSRF